MKISLVIPTLDRYESLNSLLRGICDWPSHPHEIIVVDQTPFITGRDNVCLSEIQIPVKHIKPEFRGPCKARNLGAGIAQGDILWFLDDDMAPASNTDLLARIHKHFEVFPRTVLTGVFSPEPVPLKITGTYDAIRHLTRNWNVIDEEYRFSLGVLGGNVVLLRSLFLEIGGFDEGFDPNGAFEDRDFGLRCFFSGIRVYQAAWLHLEHLGLATGGRREIRHSENLFYFWSKYIDEDVYYINALSYWLSQRRANFIRRFLRFLAIRVFRYPEYRSLKHPGI